MGTAPAENYAPIADAWPFPASGVVADLGGGGGSLIRAVLERHPKLRGMLVDREASIEAAAAHFNGASTGGPLRTDRGRSLRSTCRRAPMSTC